jgi:hypothetical protein
MLFLNLTGCCLNYHEGDRAVYRRLRRGVPADRCLQQEKDHQGKLTEKSFAYIWHIFTELLLYRIQLYFQVDDILLAIQENQHKYEFLNEAFK